jgi:hypothetical protein
MHLLAVMVDVSGWSVMAALAERGTRGSRNSKQNHVGISDQIIEVIVGSRGDIIKFVVSSTNSTTLLSQTSITKKNT